MWVETHTSLERRVRHRPEVLCTVARWTPDPGGVVGLRSVKTQPFRLLVCDSTGNGRNSFLRNGPSSLQSLDQGCLGGCGTLSEVFIKDSRKLKLCKSLFFLT